MTDTKGFFSETSGTSGRTGPVMTCGHVKIVKTLKSEHQYPLVMSK